VPKPKKTRSELQTAIPGSVGDRFTNELYELIEGLSEFGGYKSMYLNQEIWSKYCDPKTTAPDVRRRRAISKWLDTEQRNWHTNIRLQITEADLGWITWLDLRDEIRALIARVLGPVKYPSVIQDGVLTNGASTRVRKSPSAALLKLLGEGHITSDALKHWFAAYSNTQLSNQTLTLVEGSVLFTVPKKSDIDRAAAKEPECNMLMQRSVGNHIRRRLREFGIDLNNQTANQNLAREGSHKGNLATIDLSSASDSISRQLVLELLPYEWFSLLDDLRVKSTLIADYFPPEYCDHGESFRWNLEMFSSMGNGFTFELESLIFYAITRVVCRRSKVPGRISVYGDDIICPVGVVPRLKRVFDLLGFQMNLKKTHYRGPFRESCGRHYWRGFDVSPFYVRREVRDLKDLISHLNHLLEWDGRGWGFFQTEEVYRFWLRWIHYVPDFLWGGVSPDDPSALVTGHAPRKRIVAVTRKAKRPPQGGLLYWLLCREHDRNPTQWVQSEWEHFDLTPPGEDCLIVDPRLVVGWKAVDVISRGERTTWTPGIAFCE